jgi:hypothetical protein
MWPGMFQQEKKTPETINERQVCSGLMTERQVFEEFHLTREDLLQAWAKTGEITPIIVGDEVCYIRTQLEEQAVALESVPSHNATRIRH